MCVEGFWSSTRALPLRILYPHYDSFPLLFLSDLDKNRIQLDRSQRIRIFLKKNKEGNESHKRCEEWGNTGEDCKTHGHKSVANSVSPSTERF